MSFIETCKDAPEGKLLWCGARAGVASLRGYMLRVHAKGARSQTLWQHIFHYVNTFVNVSANSDILDVTQIPVYDRLNSI